MSKDHSAMARQQFDMKSFFDVLRRRRRQMLLPAAGIFAGSVLLALILPSMYRSSATILIEHQNISQQVVQTTVAGYVEQRLEQLSQVVLGRVNLLRLINKMNLYPDERSRLTEEELVEKMRKNIALKPVEADVGAQTSNKSDTATIAFDISFDDRNPNKAAAVASELASLYLEANLKTREETATSAVEFLQSQLDQLRKNIDAKDAKLTDFKEAHLNELPELQQINLASADKLERDQASLEEELRSLQSRKAYLEGQLATIDPNAGAVGPDGTRYLSPREERNQLQRQYVSMRATLGAKHPDVIRIKRQLKALNQELGGSAEAKVYAQDLHEKEQRLETLRRSATERHPDVIVLKREIAALKKRIATARSSAATDGGSDAPTNPAYIALKAQVASAAIEIRGVQQQLTRLSTLGDDYRKRLEGTPAVEKTYQEMMRDIESDRAKYRELSARLMTAKESAGLEESQIGDKFTLIAPPLVPQKPAKPNRPLIVLLGAVLAVFTGVGTALLLESLDHSIRSPQTLAALTDAPVLAVVPYVEPAVAEGRRAARMRLLVPLAVLLVVFLLLLAVHTFYMPLDVLGISLWHRLEVFF